MATKTKKLTKIDDSTMGIYKLPSYQESKLKAVYYALQEVYGKSSEAKSGTNWKKAEWQQFKSKFQETFGTIEQPKYTVEQMIQFSIDRFNKGLEELLEVNRKTWQRREKYLANQPEVI
jgi:hypothetical protein